MKNYKVKILSLKNLHDSNIKMSAIFFEEERPEVSHWLNDRRATNITKQNRFNYVAFRTATLGFFISSDYFYIVKVREKLNYIITV